MCYQNAYHAPCYVVPSDDKEKTRLIVSQIILDMRNGRTMAYPKTTIKRWLDALLIRGIRIRDMMHPTRR